MWIRTAIVPVITYSNSKKYGEREIIIPQIRPEEATSVIITKEYRVFYETHEAFKIPMPNGEIITIHF